MTNKGVGKVKKLELPLEVQEIFEDYKSALDLKESYVKRPFGFKKALKASKFAENRRLLFWRKVEELYPETTAISVAKNVEYNPKTGCIEYETKEQVK